MAGLSREQNLEIKYLRKVLSEVDGQIKLPDSLRGDVLRRQIEHITPAPEPVTAKTLLKPKRWFTWQSGLTYAAAFALIVGLFYGLGFNNSGTVLEGGVDLAVQDDVVPTDQDEAGTLRMSPESYSLESAEIGAQDWDSHAGSGETAVDSPDVGGPATGGAGGSAQQSPSTYVGGNSESVMMQQMNGYVLTYRVNDRNDPDKVNYPISLEILSLLDDNLIAQVDLPVDSLDFYFVSGDTLALGGQSSESVMIYTLDMRDMEEPVLSGSFEQPGDYVSARLYEDYLHVASYTQDASGLTMEVEELPDRQGGGVCVLTGVNLEDNRIAQKAFAGASEKIRLYNLSAYITYETPGDPGSEAQVLLEGLEMQIGSVA